MKKVLLMMALVVGFYADAQTTKTSDLILKKSLTLADKKITSISTDSSCNSKSTLKLVTERAAKLYADTAAKEAIAVSLPLLYDSVISLTQADENNNGFLSAADYEIFASKDTGKWSLFSSNLYNVNSGYVGIGTSAPAYKLDVNGDFRYNSDKLYNTWGLYMYGNSSSTFLGRLAGNLSASGQDNIGIGKFALQSLSSGAQNVAIGTSAGYGITTGSSNIYIGRNAGVYSSTANYNVLIGTKSSGDDNYTGNSNIAIGYNIVVPNTAASNQLNIGGWIYGAGGNIGIGVAVPAEKLEVNGNIKTAAPTNGAGVWKLGKKITATVAAITTGYIEVEIDGVTYKLALVN